MLLTLLVAFQVAPAADTLTDLKIAVLATAPYDKRAKMNTHEMLGVHHGAKVVVGYPCSDICPAYTTRVIHYTVSPGPDCKAIGGKLLRIPIPIGTAMVSKEYCVPAMINLKTKW